MLFTEVALVLVLIVVNGALAGSELAVVSARPARLRSMADAGRRGGATALALQQDAGRFLSAVQIGITLVGVLSGAFSGATLGRRLTDALAGAGVAEGTASLFGVGGVVAVITYLSLVIGELVPKHLALRNPEGVACAVAPSLQVLSRVAALPVWLLDRSTRLVLRLLGQDGEQDDPMTEEEMRVVLTEADAAGVLEPGEQAMIHRLLLLGDRRVHAVITPRVDVEVIDLTRPVADLVAQIRASPYSRFPAHEGDRDHMVGVLDTKLLIGMPPPLLLADLRQTLLDAPEVVESADARDALLTLQASPVHMALVYDEYGGFEGIVTATDILEAIVGEFVDESGEPTPTVVAEGDGWRVRGTAHAGDVAAELGLELGEAQRRGTIGGVVVATLARMPRVGDTVQLGGFTVRVTAMEARRIGWLHLSPVGADGRADQAPITDN